MTSKLKAHGSFSRFARVALPRPSECSKCGSKLHTSLACPRDRKPLERTTRINPRRETERRSSREHDTVYMARVRTLPCCAIGMAGHVCTGPVVAHHAGTHGMGQKCSDSQTIALCSLAHTCLHDLRGPFAGWTRARMREWEELRIAETQRELGYLTTTNASL